MSTGVDLKIDRVKVSIEGGDLKSVDIDGRTDIFGHPDVKMFTEDHQGRIVRIDGEFLYDGRRFDFKVGYMPSDGYGLVKVRKKGRKTGDIEIIQEAYDFLYETYEQYFVDV